MAIIALSRIRDIRPVSVDREMFILYSIDLVVDSARKIQIHEIWNREMCISLKKCSTV